MTVKKCKDRLFQLIKHNRVLWITETTGIVHTSSNGWQVFDGRGLDHPYEPEYADIFVAMDVAIHQNRLQSRPAF